MKNKIISTGALLLLLSGCQMALPLPTVEHPQEVTFVSPVQEQRRIAFAGGLFDIKRGELYVAYPYWHWSVPNVNVGLYVCNPTLQYRLARSQGYWSEDENIFKENWPSEAGVFVERALGAQGYDIKQHRQSFFDDLSRRPSADLLLSMRIIDMKMNMCYVHSPFYGYSLGRSGGNGVVTVEWEVYDGVRERILGSFITQGYGAVDEPLQSGDKALLMNALQNAAENLGHTEWFYKMMTTMDPVDLIPETEFDLLTLKTRAHIYHKPIQDQYSHVRKAVISVRAEKDWLGSGFFINDQGYALTAAHVVGDAKMVQIMDSNGTKYSARVLRVNRRRDVALIKADIVDNIALPVAEEERTNLVETVYAIGTPYANNYRTTVTKGIISAHRYHVFNGMNYIQADVTTTSGFSGGPLTDDKGNVIGLSVKNLSSKGSESAFSLFVPIHEALKVLNIQMEGETFK